VSWIGRFMLRPADIAWSMRHWCYFHVDARSRSKLMALLHRSECSESPMRICLGGRRVCLAMVA
jgi:hypothetical protein